MIIAGSAHAGFLHKPEHGAGTSRCHALSLSRNSRETQSCDRWAVSNCPSAVVLVNNARLTRQSAVTACFTAESLTGRPSAGVRSQTTESAPAAVIIRSGRGIN